jgi:hypothetical protein
MHVFSPGSRGSRISIFSWNINKLERSLVGGSHRPIVIPKLVWRMKATPGISASALNPQSVMGPLSKLIAGAMKALEYHSFIYHLFPIYLMATAGKNNHDDDDAMLF